MSAIDPRTVDPAKPHPSGNMGHEMSDFSWTSVLWLLPLSIIVLAAFTLVSLFWFRGAKTVSLTTAETRFSTEELKLHRTQEREFLSGYKILDKEGGRVRIPIERAMELVVQESQGKGAVDWKPVTDTYMLGAAFAAKAPQAVETAPAPEAKTGEPTTAPAGAKPVPAAVPPKGKGAEPAQKAQEKRSEQTAPGGGMGTDPRKKAP